MSKLIMIIDDSPSIQQVVSLVLKTKGYVVMEACDGVDALKKLSNQKVNLIVCDYNMPVMDGITFIKTIKQSPLNKFTPILMLTTESTEAKKTEAKLAGAQAYCVKPFKPETLLAAVQKLLI